LLHFFLKGQSPSRQDGAAKVTFAEGQNAIFLLLNVQGTKSLCFLHHIMIAPSANAALPFALNLPH
jgi:hypothetical protein